MGTIANIRVGRPDTTPSAPSHTPGVPEGNESWGVRLSDSRLVDGQVRATARRSTGINAIRREPIDPRSPSLTPA